MLACNDPLHGVSLSVYSSSFHSAAQISSAVNPSILQLRVLSAVLRRAPHSKIHGPEDFGFRGAPRYISEFVVCRTVLYCSLSVCVCIHIYISAVKRLKYLIVINRINTIVNSRLIANYFLC